MYGARRSRSLCSRLLAVLATLAASGCFQSGTRPIATTSDAATAPGADAPPLATRERCGLFDVDIRISSDDIRPTRISRARDGDSTWIVTGSRDGASLAFRPLVVYRLEFDGDGPVVRGAIELESTVAYAPLDVSRDGNRLAIFAQSASHNTDVFVVDDRGRVASRYDFGLGAATRGAIAMRGTRITTLRPAPPRAGDGVLVERIDAATGTREWSSRIEGVVTNLAVTNVPPPMKSSMVHYDTMTRRHSLELVTIAGGGTVHEGVPMADPMMTTWDATHLAVVQGSGQVLIDGIDAGAVRADSYTGEPSLAVSGARRVLALVANETLVIGTSTRPGDALRFVDLPLETLAGYPIAHADRRHLGVFFLETPSGAERARIRYLGTICE